MAALNAAWSLFWGIKQTKSIIGYFFFSRHSSAEWESPGPSVSKTPSETQTPCQYFSFSRLIWFYLLHFQQSETWDSPGRPRGGRFIFHELQISPTMRQLFKRRSLKAAPFRRKSERGTLWFVWFLNGFCPLSEILLAAQPNSGLILVQPKVQLNY